MTQEERQLVTLAKIMLDTHVEHAAHDAAELLRCALQITKQDDHHQETEHE